MKFLGAYLQQYSVFNLQLCDHVTSNVPCIIKTDKSACIIKTDKSALHN